MLLPAETATFDFIAKRGRHVLQCPMSDHSGLGMTAILDVSGEIEEFDDDEHDNAHGGEHHHGEHEVHEISLRAEEVDWDYLGAGAPDETVDRFETWLRGGGERFVGSVYRKCVYRAYSHDFAEPLVHASEWGVLGPLLHFVVGEDVVVNFENACSIPTGLSFYEFDIDTLAGDSDATLLANGERRRYVYHVPISAGPDAVLSPSLYSLTYVYGPPLESGDYHVLNAAGLFGAYTVNRVDAQTLSHDDIEERTVAFNESEWRSALPSAAVFGQRIPQPFDTLLASEHADVSVHQHSVVGLLLFNEAESPYLAHNWATRAPNASLDDPDVEASLKMHTINGYVGYVPELAYEARSTVRFHLLSVGNSFVHAFAIGDAAYREVDSRMAFNTDSSALAAGTTLAIDVIMPLPGAHELRCAVDDHIDAGMVSTYATYAAPRNEESLKQAKLDNSKRPIREIFLQVEVSLVVCFLFAFRGRCLIVSIRRWNGTMLLIIATCCITRVSTTAAPTRPTMRAAGVRRRFRLSSTLRLVWARRIVV